MADDIQNNWGAQALDTEQNTRRWQYNVHEGCAVTVGANAMEIDVDNGTVAVAGTRHNVGATTVTLSASQSDPRKDVIYVDSSGAVQVAEGQAKPARPQGQTGRDTYQPLPSDLSQMDATPLAEIWVGAGVSDITSGDVSDRRQFADLSAANADVESLSTEEQNSTIYWATEDKYPRWYDVQNLIDDVPKGAEIRLEARQYPLDFIDEGTVKINTEGVTLRGAGHGSHVFLENDTTNANEGADILEITADNVTIEDFRVDGNWQNNDPGEQGEIQDGHNIASQGVTGFTARNIWSVNGTGDGIELVNSDDCLIINPRLYDNWEHGIGLNGAQKSTILGGIVDGERNNGLIDTWNGATNDDTERIKIIGTTLRNGQDAGLTIDGGEGAVRDIDVIAVTVENCAKECFAVIPGGEQTQVPNVTVRDSEFINEGSGYGVRIDGPKNFSMRGTTIRDNPKHGMRILAPITNSEVVGNDILNNNQNDNNGRGIVVQVPDATSLDELEVDDNTIKSESAPYHESGIFSTGPGTFNDTYYVRDNTIVNVQNERVENSFPQRPRIQLRNGQGVVEDDDTYTTSGDGSTTTFTIPHKLDVAPTQYSVDALTADATGYWISNTTQNVIEVSYSAAPADGTDNLQWHYRAVSD